MLFAAHVQSVRVLHGLSGAHGSGRLWPKAAALLAGDIAGIAGLGPIAGLSRASRSARVCFTRFLQPAASCLRRWEGMTGDDEHVRFLRPETPIGIRSRMHSKTRKCGLLRISNRWLIVTAFVRPISNYGRSLCVRLSPHSLQRLLYWQSRTSQRPRSSRPRQSHPRVCSAHCAKRKAVRAIPTVRSA